MDVLKVYLFGTPRFEYHGTALNILRRKAVALMAYLALTTQPQSRDVLATLLWPELDDRRSRGALRSTLYTLTTQIPGIFEEGSRSILEINSEGVWVDVREFRGLLAQRRSHGHDPETLCDVCIELALRADQLYRADLMEGFSLADSAEFDDWQLIQRESLRREFGTTLRRLAQHYGEAAKYESAVQYAERWLALDPLHEPAHRLLMQLYADGGQRTQAMRQYEACVALLDEQLATPPEEETTRLYHRIRSTPREQAVTSTTTITGTLPPLSNLVVGREEALEDLKTRLREGRNVTMVQGWPGIGKSTIVAKLAHEPEIPGLFPDGVLWTSLGETPNLFGELHIWAKALKVVDDTGSPSLEQLVSRLTIALRERRVLLIVDDVWKVEHAVPFRVGGQHCALVLTSRLNDVAEALAPNASDVYRLKVLTEASALELLVTLAPEVVADYPEEARELVRSLEGLPLAIQVAGRLLHNEARLGWGVANLLEELREGAALLTAQAPSDTWNGTTMTVAALLKRSTDALDDLMRVRFADLGMFVPKPATFDLKAMSVVWGVDDPKPTARILVNRGLLEPVSGGRFQMHALLVMHARGLMEQA